MKKEIKLKKQIYQNKKNIKSHWKRAYVNVEKIIWKRWKKMKIILTGMENLIYRGLNEIKMNRIFCVTRVIGFFCLRN